MPVAIGANLSKSYGADLIFDGVSFQIQERDRIALVGVNGSGKSTLLRILAGVEPPDRGTVTYTSGTRLGYLPQEVTFPAGKTLREYILGAFERLQRLEQELRAVEAELSAAAQAPPARRVEALLERHGHLLHDYEHNGGYTYQSKIREVLAGLGIGEDRLDQPLETFSGGQRTRVALASLLLSGQDLLLMDEPTNHLDLAATEWLEDYLAQARQAIVVVSHDRYFLDTVATRTWELTFGRLEAYTGNYSQFAGQRAERQLRLEREYQRQQAYIARTEAFIRRYRAGQRYRQARGRQKQLDRLERVERGRDPGQMKLVIQSTLRSGETVLALEGLAVAAGTPPAPAGRTAPGMPVVREAPRGGFPDALPLFTCPDLEVRRGDRVAIIGPNGSGKTTFLRVLTGDATPAAGRVYVGYGVQVAYYAQAHEQLRTESTVIEEIQATKPLGEEAARTYLGRLLFTGDDVFKRVSSLSGGERSRLALAKLALGNANLLVLDEPTNHLDIYAREALEDVLSSFAGTIVFVSHDRYLIDSLARDVWEVGDGRLRVHKGTWSDYVEARRRERAAQEEAAAAARAAAAASDPRQIANQEARLRARQVAVRQALAEELEGEIATLEARLHLLAGQIEAASAEADAQRIAELGRQHAATAAELATCEEEWLAVHQTLEELAAASPVT